LRDDCNNSIVVTEGIISLNEFDGTVSLAFRFLSQCNQEQWGGTASVPSDCSCALKKKKMGRHRGRPSHDARIPPFYAPGVDAGESAGIGEGERGTADAGSDI
jgi:hypothetical protein